MINPLQARAQQAAQSGPSAGAISSFYGQSMANNMPNGLGGLGQGGRTSLYDSSNVGSGQMGLGRGLQMGGQRMGTANPNMFTNYGDFDPRFRPQQSNPQQSNMVGGQATYLTEPRAMHHGMLGGAPIDYERPTGPEATFQPMLSPQPVQSQYRPIPFMNQTQVDARDAAAAAAAAPPPSYDGGGGFKKGGDVEDGIASLLKK
jgi:hypothetical protein